MIIKIFLCGIAPEEAEETSPQLFTLLNQIVDYEFVQWNGTLNELVRMGQKEPFLVHLPMGRLGAREIKGLYGYCEQKSVIFANDEWVTAEQNEPQFLGVKALLQEVEAKLRPLGTAISVRDPADPDTFAIHVVPKVWNALKIRAVQNDRSIRNFFERLIANAVAPLDSPVRMGKPGNIQGITVVRCGRNPTHTLNCTIGKDDTPLRIVTEAQWRHFDEYGYVCPTCTAQLVPPRKGRKPS